ncbi:hypothetical protein, partial [Plasmodium yoelii yoelii]
IHINAYKSYIYRYFIKLCFNFS